LQKEKPINYENLKFPIDFNFKKYQFYEDLLSFLHDIDVSRIFFTPAYPTPYDYYRDNFYLNKKRKGGEYFFSTKLILSATTMRFPVLLNS